MVYGVTPCRAWGCDLSLQSLWFPPVSLGPGSLDTKRTLRKPSSARLLHSLAAIPGEVTRLRLARNPTE